MGAYDDRSRASEQEGGDRAAPERELQLGPRARAPPLISVDWTGQYYRTCGYSELDLDYLDSK